MNALDAKFTLHQIPLFPLLRLRGGLLAARWLHQCRRRDLPTSISHSQRLLRLFVLHGHLKAICVSVQAKLRQTWLISGMNSLECHFIMRGPADSPYAGGEYHGTLIFPPQYPFSPPGIKVFTPSGRFQPDRKLCTSFSDFHAGSWNPAWSVSTILTGLLSFMLSDEITTGSIRSSDSEKREFAKSSHAWNLYVSTASRIICSIADSLYVWGTLQEERQVPLDIP